MRSDTNSRTEPTTAHLPFKGGNAVPKSFRIIVPATVLIWLLSSVVIAKTGGGDGQFSRTREKYKYTFQLMSMVRHIEEIDRNPKYKLTQDQAKQVLAILQPLRSKPKLTQDQAKEVLKRLKPVFTVTQLNAMAKIRNMRPVGQGGPGGQGRPGAQGRRPRFDPDAMKDFNPFYTKVSADDEWAARRAERWNRFFKALDARAKGVAAPAKAPAKKPAPKPAPAKKSSK